MSVIIRLQNLPWSANATDIRQFFKGLGIPDGGVHIVGGENGDAFIAFRYVLTNCFFRNEKKTECKLYIQFRINFLQNVALMMMQEKQCA